MGVGESLASLALRFRCFVGSFLLLATGTGTGLGCRV